MARIPELETPSALEDRISALEEALAFMQETQGTHRFGRAQTAAVSLDYIEGPDDKVFVRFPNEKGRWALAERCVVEVACPVCEAMKGELCRNQYHLPALRYWVGTHCDRRSLAVKSRRMTR